MSFLQQYQWQCVRVYKIFTSVGLWISLLIFSVMVCAAFEENSLPGIYQPIAESGKRITLNLQSNHVAIIEKVDPEIYVIVQYSGTWKVNGENIEVSYNVISEVLHYDDLLSFEEFGIALGAPGLKVPPGIRNSGSIGSTSLWRRDALQHISRIPFKLKGIQISETDHDMPILYLLSPGILCVCLGLILGIRHGIFVSHARSSVGIVIANAERFPMVGHTTFVEYAPKVRVSTIRFTAENGKTYECRDNSFRGWLSGDVGSKIPLLYHASNPEKALIRNAFTLWGMAVFLVLFGLVLMYAVY